MEKSPTKAVCAFLTRRKRFTLDECVKDTALERRKALRVLEKFAREGFLRVVEDRRERGFQAEMGPARKNPRYEKVKEVSARRPKRPACGRDKVWRTLRHLRRATRSNIARITGCSPVTVEDYTRRLEKHGYLRSAGKPGSEKVFFLVNDPGPEKPRIGE